MFIGRWIPSAEYRSNQHCGCAPAPPSGVRRATMLGPTQQGRSFRRRRRGSQSRKSVQRGAEVPPSGLRPASPSILTADGRGIRPYARRSAKAEHERPGQGNQSGPPIRRRRWANCRCRRNSTPWRMSGCTRKQRLAAGFRLFSKLGFDEGSRDTSPHATRSLRTRSGSIRSASISARSTSRT
jgi:hypothetical protein